MNWDKRFLELCVYLSQWSKDPSTRVAAIVVSPDRQIVSTGYNGFPRGIADTDERLNDRDTIRSNKTLSPEEYDAGLERLRLELQRKVKAPSAN